MVSQRIRRVKKTKLQYIIFSSDKWRLLRVRTCFICIICVEYFSRLHERVSPTGWRSSSAKKIVGLHQTYYIYMYIRQTDYCTSPSRPPVTRRKRAFKNTHTKDRNVSHVCTSIRSKGGWVHLSAGESCCITCLKFIRENTINNHTNYDTHTHKSSHNLSFSAPELSKGLSNRSHSLVLLLYLSAVWGASPSTLVQWTPHIIYISSLW